MKRRYDSAFPELMDRPQPVSHALEVDLLNLRQLNRFFGSHALVRHFLRRWIKVGSPIRIADLATGSGDIPRLIVDYARAIGATVAVDAVDFQAATLSIARGLSAAYPEIAFHCANIGEWGEANSYDLVVCSLALHHFSDDDAVAILARCRQLSRVAVLVADLRRGWLASLGVWLLTALVFREPMTKVDARLSAERAFSFEEFSALALRAGWTNFGHRRFRFARQAIWMEQT